MESTDKDTDLKFLVNQCNPWLIFIYRNFHYSLQIYRTQSL